MPDIVPSAGVELSLDEMEMVDGGKATYSAVLATGAAICGVGVLVLSAPVMALVAGAALGAYVIVRVAMGLGTANARAPRGYPSALAGIPSSQHPRRDIR